MSQSARIQRIHAMLRDGRTQSEIAAEVGCVESAVSYHASKLGIVTRPDANRRYDWKVIRQEYEAGDTYQELRDRHGFTETSWRNAFRRGSLLPLPDGRPTLIASTRQLPSPTLVGNHSEAVVLAALLRTKTTVLIPFGSNHRYDLAFEEDGRLFRVQVKTAQFSRGVLRFNTRSSRDWPRGTCYRGEVEFLAVHAPFNGKVYLVPPAEVGPAAGYLRLEPTKSGQQRGIRWAADYEVA